MVENKYKNIRITNKVEEANCITHSGRFHVDDIISTIFLSKIMDNIILARVPSVEKIDIENKIVYDIGLGEFDHHQKNRNGKRDNGIFYSSIGLLWKKFGKDYLRKIRVKYLDKVFEYIDKELIQNIDAEDNMQFEFVENKITPNFVKLCNPKWNENISENEAFMNAIKLADGFWNVYINNAIAEVEGMEIVIEKILKCRESYIIFDTEMPYKKVIQKFIENKIKYIIYKSRREGYEVRTIGDTCKFKDELVGTRNIEDSKKVSGNNELRYVDNNGKLCCTETLESAIKLIKYNEDFE